VDPRNGLVAYFASIALALEADVVVMENVPELLTGPHSAEYEAFSKQMLEAGYSVDARILSANDYGTPQRRRRAIVICQRTGASTDFSALLPATDLVRTVRDAIGDLPILGSGESLATDPLHSAVTHKQSTLDVIRAVTHDGGMRPKGVGPASLDRVAGFSDVYGRLRWDSPSVTITKYARNPASGRYVHPDQDRGLTAREASRLQGFPDSFTFSGRRDDIYRQIGEAVPPPLGIAVAEAVSQLLSSGSLE
jgi:DNA (cytosine-5)-methyltransferase 1